uniref:Uncharacterized protein n=1 Tax=Plectus sambesii TaxID=2011161 RepID=A0A914VRE0_9BILA
MLKLNATLEYVIETGKEYQNVMKKLSSGIENQQHKEMHFVKITWDLCMKWGKVFPNQTKKLSNGSGKPQGVCLNLLKKLPNGIRNQQDKDLRKRNVTWDLCIGMVKACLSQMKKPSNGTQNQQNKDMHVRNITWDLCTKMVKACLNQM